MCSISSQLCWDRWVLRCVSETPAEWPGAAARRRLSSVFWPRAQTAKERRQYARSRQQKSSGVSYLLHARKSCHIGLVVQFPLFGPIPPLRRRCTLLSETGQQSRSL
eukprot:2118577-Pleurochrysis_carterae.AAC.3